MKKLCLVLFIPLFFATVFAQKKPLEHDVYDSWNTIAEDAISNDGKWILYAINPRQGDGVLVIEAVNDSQKHQVERGKEATFSANSQFAIYQIAPPFEEARQAKRDKKKADEQPKDNLGFLNLYTGTSTVIERVKSFKIPKENGDWVAYLLEKPLPDSTKTEDKTEQESENKEEEKAENKDPDEKEKPKKKETLGTTLVVVHLPSGKEQRFESVSDYLFAENGKLLAFTTSTKDGEKDGVFLLNTETDTTTPLLEGMSAFKYLTFDKAGNQFAFLSNKAHYGQEPSAFALHFYQQGKTQVLADSASSFLPDGWWVSENGSLRFSESGQRLFFGIAPKPLGKAPEIPTDELVNVDIWNWKDPLLQPMQLVQAKQEEKRSYEVVYHLNSKKFIQLEVPNNPSVSVGNKGDAPYAVVNNNYPYRQEISWESPSFNDVSLLNVNTGISTPVLQKFQGAVQISPQAKYLYWWDGSQKAWFVQKTPNGTPINVSKDIPFPVENEDHDWPYLVGSNGISGWTENDAWLLINDTYDIWAVDPLGKKEPRSITEGFGRKEGFSFRYVRLDPDETNISTSKPILLRAFHLTNKSAGFFTDSFADTSIPKQLMLADKRFSYPTKAKDADILLYTRESFTEFPDIWTSTTAFTQQRKHSTANPQQEEYFWGEASLHTWHSIEGTPLQGILITPENFDSQQQYPLLVYFYERSSDGLHTHRAPEPYRSIINPTFYTSRGYVVFIPDIPYQIGYPGESSMDAVLPGILSLVEKGFIDKDRIGVEGHSWGGYQIAYMVTKTNLFKAAAAGAPVSNMFSAYGGIRWDSGMSRMFQYERTQSRIGGTIWDYPLRYLENSPIFWADKVNTPILMMHNDKDGAVPWYQGIEYFVALRRLQKPAWLVNYNDEPHNLTKYQNRKDWAIRMQQFFDHYLMGAPAPIWMEEGVPAVSKGRTLGLELIEE